ncbi:STS14 protein [Eutrema salsugineum]|nr:STS14 protein [Eutrema salsugineum]XP_024007378.1 STS14 protein [Eutrema salsugineum]
MAAIHHIILVTLLVISVAAVSPPSKSKPTRTRPASPPTISAAAKAFTDAHNKARATVGVSPLVWSQTLEAAASRLARYQRNQKKCEFASPNPGRYGANQLWAKGLAVTPSLAVETWVKEKPFYDYKSNTCDGNHTCGVYKQVVWRDSKELGCAQATCTKESTVLTICFYNPPGNIVGQKPY